MLTLKHISSPSLLLEKDGIITLRTGSFKTFETLDELQVLQNNHNNDVVFIIPFCSARENGMEARGNEDILAIQVEETGQVSALEIENLCSTEDIRFKKPFEPTLSDEMFSREVKNIQDEEIAAGNACQVIFSRKFEAELESMSPMLPLILFSRLLKQQGQYITFLFSDGEGHYFVGASPERQLEIHDETVIKNPISGTMPKGELKGFPQRLNDFLQDKKEINELSQILDEELKIMSQICPRGGKISGPFLREAGAVIHTEYHLLGHSKKPALTALRISLHAPTLVGSPLESAFRIIARRESESRRYYGGEIGVIQKNGDMYSAIMIRTAEIFKDGKISIQAGAGVVRDSIPLKEAQETQAKAAGLIRALTGDFTTTGKYISDSLLAELDHTLKARNSTFSRFHLEDQIGHRDMSNLHQESITIINNEDNFAFVLSHITRYLGYNTTIVDTFDYDVSNDVSDLVVLGPGPGDINDENNPRMKQLLKITKELAVRNIPTLGICLGIQAMAKTMGMPVKKQNIPSQGLQSEINLFGKKERVGFYNSFSPVAENIPDNFEVSVNKENRVMALRSENIYGFQFHVESAMTENGLDILTEALTSLMGVRERRMLSFEAFVEKSISGKLNLEAQKQFLIELNQRGYSGNDIADLVKVFYKQMPSHLKLPNAIDLCGTGGSGLARINTSTMTAIILAACGVPVAKHGNKAASGRFGSFDLLESLGLNIMADKPRLEAMFKELNLAFIFARSFHPVFKHFAEVRQEIKSKTIFNILGPLLNPANPQVQIIGTSNRADMQLIAEAARALGKQKVLVLTGSDGLDELTLTGETEVMELKNGAITHSVLTPEDFGLKQVPFSEISGGDERFNVKITRDILSGDCSSAHFDLVLANVALALKFMGRVADYKEGVRHARSVIKAGLATRIIEQYGHMSHAPDILLEIATEKRTFIEALKKTLPLIEIQKDLKPSDRDFKSALADKQSLGLIAEIKKASPSEKTIYTGSASVAEIARLYESSGADAISVLTDEKHFSGSLENLRIARESTQTTPLLMKDFIIDPYQIYLARHYGADAILLIAALLTQDQLIRYMEIAESLNMDALVEVHNKEELEIVLKTKASIVGVNNRDLHTFNVDISTYLKLHSLIPNSIIRVAESGYTPENAGKLTSFADAVLVGSAIIKSADMTQAIKAIKTPQKSFKACGIRTVKDAKTCRELGIDYVGLNFVPVSKRRLNLPDARDIISELGDCLKVGVFQNQEPAEVNQIAVDLGLDFIQLAGSESVDYCCEMKKPVIKTLKIADVDLVETYQDVVAMFIIDGSTPGSGLAYDYSRLKDFNSGKPYFVAGGVTTENANEILSILPNAAGLDVASGIETEGLVDTQKIKAMLTEIQGSQK